VPAAITIEDLSFTYPVAFALSTALRLVPTFVGAGATIIQAQRSRGLDLDKGNIFRLGLSLGAVIPHRLYRPLE